MLEIRMFEDEDISIMEHWLNKDYIKKWYNAPEDWLNEIRQRFDTYSFVKHFIVCFNKNPIGFCQYYTCSDAGEDWYGDIPLEGTYSIDYLIGEENYLSKGYGKAIIALLIKKLFSLEDCKRIVVQPEADNLPSTNSLLANEFVFDEKNELYIKFKE